MLSNLSIPNAMAASVDFTKLFSTPNTAEFLAEGSTETVRTELRIKHQPAGKGVIPGTENKRHLTQVVLKKYNSTLGKMQQLGVNLTFVGCIDGTVFDDADLADVLAFAYNAMQNNRTAITAGEL